MTKIKKMLIAICVLLMATSCVRNVQKEENAPPWLPYHSLRGSWLITTDGPILRVNDLDGKTILCQMEGHTKDVDFATFSYDGSQIASASMDGTVRVWDALTGNQKFVFFATNGHRFHTVAFSANGRWLIASGSDGFIHRLDLQEVATKRQPPQRLIGHQGAVRSAFFSPTADRIVSASMDGTVRVWNVETQQVISTLTFQHKRPLFAVFDPTGKKVVITFDGRADQACLWEVKNPSLSFCFHDGNEALPKNPERGAMATFSVDGSTVLIAGTLPFVQLWDTKTGQLRATYSGHDLDPDWISFSSQGDQMVVSASEEAASQVWFVSDSQRPAFVVPHQPAKTLDIDVFSDGQSWARLTSANSIVIHRMDTGEEIKSIPLQTHHANRLLLSPNGKYMVTASKSHVRVWDTQTGARIQNMPIATNEARIGSFDKQGLLFAVADPVHGNVYLWDAIHWKYLSDLHVADGKNDQIQSIDLSPSGDHLAVASFFLPADVSAAPVGEEALVQNVRRHISVYDTTNQKRLLDWVDPDPSGTLKQVVFSPDGRSLLTVGGHIQQWDVTNGKLLGVLGSASTDEYAFARFSPDSQKVFAWGRGGCVIWDMASKQWTSRVVGESVKNVQFWRFFSNDSRLMAYTDDVQWMWSLPGFGLEQTVSSVADNMVIVPPVFEQHGDAQAPLLVEPKPTLSKKTKKQGNKVLPRAGKKKARVGSPAKIRRQRSKK